MKADKSENLFAAYLDSQSISFDRHFPVHGKKNVDFRLIKQAGKVLCDVKEARESSTGSRESIDAYAHIRKDIMDLRKKFGNKKPVHPVVLVTMNFSSNFFTGHTVVRAMYGDVGATFTSNRREDIQHLPRGNASMTRATNTSISGILVFDCASNNHAYFSNEFAELRLPLNYFPNVTEYSPSRTSSEEHLVSLCKLTYWECG